MRPRTIEIGDVRMIVDRARMRAPTIDALYHGDYETAERIIVGEALRPGDRILEGGAGMGLISLTAARIVGAGNIVSYEPTPAAYSILDENARLNDLAIERRQRALGAKAGRATFYANDNIVSSSLVAGKGGRPIEVVVDGIADALSETKANALLLDVEGAEVELIEACPLERIDKIVMEIHPDLVGDAAISRMYARLIAAGLMLRHDLAHGDVVTFMRETRAGRIR
jgi:FkbM family methyltransferase